MNADQRLDQLEPLLSEAMTVLDRHTYQLKRLSERVAHLIGLVVKQSDNISFLLSENVLIRERIDKQETQLNRLEAKVDRLEADVAGLKQGQVELNHKLDLILARLA